MDKEERYKLAYSCKDKGYTCCQCVVTGVSDLLDVDRVTLFKIAEGFGGGIGGLEEVCGVISAMTMVAGIVNSTGSFENNTSKESTIELTKDLAMEFRNKYHTIYCRDIRGTITGEPLADCDECIKDGMDIIIEKFNLL